jgi:hypothetical protein
MMKTYKTLTAVLLGLFTATAGYTQDDQTSIRKEINKDLIQKNEIMKTYLIEREIPEAGKLTPEQLRGISQNSNGVLSEMGPQIEWLHSYVTANHTNVQPPSRLGRVSAVARGHHHNTARFRMDVHANSDQCRSCIPVAMTSV